jgi:ABC-type transport system involved in multi-copper enzyme maturation permease subunit
VKNLIHSEWLKLRTLRGPWIAAFLLAIVGGVLVYFPTASTNQIIAFNSTRQFEVGMFDAMGMWRFAVAGLVASRVSEEFRDGTMRLSVIAAPKRLKFLLAKTLVLLVWALVFTAIAIGAALLGTRLGVWHAHGTFSLLDAQYRGRMLGWFGLITAEVFIAVAAGLLVRRSTAAWGLAVGIVAGDAILAQIHAIPFVQWILPLANGNTLVSITQKHQISPDANFDQATGVVKNFPHYVGVGRGVITMVVIVALFYSFSVWRFLRKDV